MAIGPVVNRIARRQLRIAYNRGSISATRRTRLQTECAMPVISMFYGILIRMYLLDNQHHNLPHIHARYAEHEASISLVDGEVLAGTLPRKQLRLVQAWIELHQEELLVDWNLAAEGELPFRIPPL